MVGLVVVGLVVVGLVVVGLVVVGLVVVGLPVGAMVHPKQAIDPISVTVRLLVS